jgi:hypothetical protein
VCIDDMCNASIDGALFALAPDDVEEEYKRIGPTGLVTWFHKGGIAHGERSSYGRRDVEFFQSVFDAVVVPRDRAARIPLQNVTNATLVKRKADSGMPRSCRGSEWLPRHYTRVVTNAWSSSLTWSDCLPDMARTVVDWETRIYYTIVGHIKFLDSVLQACPECAAVSDRRTKLQESSFWWRFPFGISASSMARGQRALCIGNITCIDKVLTDFQSLYGQVPLQNLLDQQFLALEFDPSIQSSSAFDNARPRVSLLARRTCLLSWNMTCRKDRFLFSLDVLVSTLFRESSARLQVQKAEIESQVLHCSFGCSPLKEFLLQVVDAGTRLRTYRLVHLIGLWQLCLTEQCRRELRQAYNAQLIEFQREVALLDSMTTTSADRGVAIISIVASSLSLVAVAAVAGFMFVRKALFVSMLHFSLLLFNLLNSILLFVFAVLSFLNSGSVVFDRLLPVLVTTLEMISLLMLLRFYLGAFYGEIRCGLKRFLWFVFFKENAILRPNSWTPLPNVLTVVVGFFMVGTCAFAGVAGWKIATDSQVSFFNDLDNYLAATLYASFVSLGLAFSVVLFVYALFGWLHLRRRDVSPFVLRSLFKLVVVTLGIFVGFGFALVFAVLRVPVFPIVAPLWAFMAFGVILPLCFVLARFQDCYICFGLIFS